MNMLQLGHRHRKLLSYIYHRLENRSDVGYNQLNIGTVSCHLRPCLILSDCFLNSSINICSLSMGHIVIKGAC